MITAIRLLKPGKIIYLAARLFADSLLSGRPYFDSEQLFKLKLEKVVRFETVCGGG